MKDHQVERLRFDARRWYASKLLPRVFGDKIVNEHSGIGGNPITLQALPAERLTPVQLAAGIKKLLTTAEQSSGLPDASDRPDGERLEAILRSRQALDPALYEALADGAQDGGDA